jgi:hypothetical protein
MTKGELKAQFVSLMNRNELKGSPALVETFINQSIQRIQRELRVPFMEKIVLYTIPSSYTKLSIPADLLELISIMVDSDNDGIIDYALQRIDQSKAAKLSQQTDIPRVFSRQGGGWIVGPRPAAGSKIQLTYFAEFAALPTDADSNTLTKVAWDAVVYGALSAACDYYTDERVKPFEDRYRQITTMLQEQADGDELTADAAVRPALNFGDD